MNLYKKYNENSVPVVIHVILCILALAFWTLFGVIAVPILLILRVFKSVISGLLVLNKHGKLLANEDVPFMHEDEQNRNYNVSLFMIKGEPSVQKIRKLFTDRVIKNNGHPSYQRLRKKIIQKYGRYIWADEEDVDIERHVIAYEEEPPENDLELERLFGEIISKPLPKDMSPWQIFVIPLKSDGISAVLTRAHHIIGDGISMVNLFSKIMDDKPVLLKPSDKLIKKYQSSAVWRVLHGFFTGPLCLLTMALSQPDNPFPRTGDVREQRIAWTEAISLTKIKEVKTKIGATINDVVTGCLAGALRRYIESTQGKCSEDVQIAVSINTRPPSMLLQDNLPLENNTTGVILTLPVTGDSVLERIELSKRRMNKIKNGSDFLVFGFIFNHVLANLPDFLARLTVNSLNTHACLILSNLPGPLNPMVIGGDEVTSIMTWPPLVGGIGMSAAIFSYADTIRLNVKTDISVFPNPKLLADFFQLEMDELFATYAKKDE